MAGDAVELRGAVDGSLGSLRTNLIIGNERVARNLVLQQGARREKILHGSLTDEQHRCRAEEQQPSWLSVGGSLAALLLSHRTHGYAPSSCLASGPPTLSALIPDYEIGSKPTVAQANRRISATSSRERRDAPLILVCRETRDL